MFCHMPCAHRGYLNRMHIRDLLFQFTNGLHCLSRLIQEDRREAIILSTHRHLSCPVKQRPLFPQTPFNILRLTNALRLTALFQTR